MHADLWLSPAYGTAGLGEGLWDPGWATGPGAAASREGAPHSGMSPSGVELAVPTPEAVPHLVPELCTASYPDPTHRAPSSGRAAPLLSPHLLSLPTALPFIPYPHSSLAAWWLGFRIHPVLSARLAGVQAEDSCSCV